MSGSTLAGPACSVEIYPFEAGPIVLTGGQIRSVTVSKSLLGGALGEFSIELAPGGPLGSDDPTTWTTLLTPMSHCLIGMSRGADAAIVMDGIVAAPSEDQVWTTQAQGSAASRGISITGGDFAWFYQQFNYYALTFYGLTAGLPKFGGGSLPLNLYSKLSQGLIGGTSSADSNPVLVGQAWYNDVMAGTTGLLSKTYVPFSGNSRYLLPSTIAQVWEKYPDVFIPYADNFMTGQEPWMAKFLSIFPHPWYEFFVTTAPAGAYVPAGAESIAGKTFSMQSMPYAPPAGPVMVARINPVPAFVLQNLSSADAAIPGDLDVSRWNALPLFDLTQVPFGFINSSVGFSARDASNFYQLNPTYYKSLAPGNNANSIPAPFFYIAAADPASVQRYGFSPQVGSIRWMCDPLGTAAQNQGLNIQETILALTGRYVSWHHPLPLMMRGQVTLPLSPNIAVGTRFRYAPFKNGEPWDFYVTSVQHRFVFGGSSITRLNLARGLPAAIYANATSEGLLRAIHTGNAMRQNGRYVVGLPPGSEQALQVITTPQQAASLAGHLAAVFSTPQSGSA
jgi:hypothetical protein